MNNQLRLADYLRAYADIHGHTISNTQVYDLEHRCRRDRRPFALVIGRTCGVRIDEINPAKYYASMRSLRRSIDQHRTVLIFCMPSDRKFVWWYDFVRLTPENYSDVYARLDPDQRVIISEGGKPGPSIWDVEPTEDAKRKGLFGVLRDCHHYLDKKALRTPERQKPKSNRCNGHGFQRTFAANELMSRY